MVDSRDPKGQVHDVVRRKNVSAGPEEKVRQALIAYLVDMETIPKGLISVEAAVKGSANRYRSDIVIYDRGGEPWMVVECKAPSISISQEGFNQLSRYNRFINAPFMMITNGADHFCCAVDAASGDLTFSNSFPHYPDVQ